MKSSCYQWIHKILIADWEKRGAKVILFPLAPFPLSTAEIMLSYQDFCPIDSDSYKWWNALKQETQCWHLRPHALCRQRIWECLAHEKIYRRERNSLLVHSTWRGNYRYTINKGNLKLSIKRHLSIVICKQWKAIPTTCKVIFSI